jgi:hypothetical protein
MGNGVLDVAEDVKPCRDCGGPRTWDYHCYCLDCNRDRKRDWMANPDNRASKRESDRESLKRRKGKPARPVKRDNGVAP